MTVANKRTWTEILRQIPTVAAISLIFAWGGWKSNVDETINRNCDTLVLYNEKGEQLQWRVVELEAIVREYRANAQARDLRLDEMNNKIDLIYQMLMEERR